MSKPANPFIYGGPVSTEQFIGRHNEINRIFDQLGSHARGSVALIGERRIGKTSLLHYVSAPDVIKRWNLDEQQSVLIFQDCGAITPFTITRFWQTVLKRLQRQLKRKKVETDLLETIQETLNQREISLLDIEFLLDDLHEAGLLLVLILDEFEWCVRADAENEAITRDFLAGLRALINHVPRVLSLIVATRQALNEVCQNVRFMGSPFYNNFVFVQLRPFSQKEAELLLEQMLANTGITFSQAEKNYIYDLTGTHPLLLQTAAALVFDFKIGGVTEIKDIFQIRQQFRDLVTHQFEDFWKWSLPREREILTRLVHDRNEAVTELAGWTDEWERLLKRGLIKREDGVYRLFSSVFWEWLIDNLYRLEEPQPPANPDLDHLRQQFQAHQRRLNILKEQAAIFGIETPPHVTIEIEDIEATLATLELRLAALKP